MHSSVSAIYAFRVYMPSRSIQRLSSRSYISRDKRNEERRKKKKKEKEKRRRGKSALGFQAGSNRGSTAIVET
jgi:hypothetical protein